MRRKNVGDEIVDTIVIPQNEDGIDTEDRITLLKNYIKANLSWVALQEGTVNDMFPLTSKMNDKFPLTQDINIGVSVHVETVVLLSKWMVDTRKVKVDFSLEDMDLSEFKGR